MVNALECLAAIDVLTDCLYDIQVMRDTKSALSCLKRFKLPGQWNPDRLHDAHLIALDIRGALREFKSSQTKEKILRKINPLVDMLKA